MALARRLGRTISKKTSAALRKIVATSGYDP